jgi:peptidoglycan L-alanyl-D-glutamate endopeptidase CwlK
MTQTQIDTLNAERLAPLMPELITKAQQMIAAAAPEVTVLVTQGLRTYAEQDALYAEGRTAPGKIVTNARGGQSNHNFGTAYDVVPIDANGQPIWNTSDSAWSTIETIGKGLGLEWGGDFTSIHDIPHWQLTGGVSLAEMRSLYKPPDDFTDVWAKVREGL